MKQFKDLGIAPVIQNFVGDKIKIERILNREITLIGYRIEQSKFTEKGNGKCLHLQIQLGEVKYVVFTGSTVLMETIQKVSKDDLPFKTTIVKQDDHFEFT